MEAEEKESMRVLDLFAGLGGFSAAFRQAGHEVDTLDNGRDGNFECTYKQDVRTFHAKRGQYDVILAGTPCTEYSRWALRCFAHNRAFGPPTNDLLRETMRIIDECKPKYWLIENVRGSIKYINAELKRAPLFRCGQRWFWGDFPIKQTDVKHEWYRLKTQRRPKNWNATDSRSTQFDRSGGKRAADLSRIEPEISAALVKSLS
jgi:hypothetical protein